MDNRGRDVEHERRFLVQDLAVLAGTSCERIDQGYLWSEGGYAIRVRRTFRTGADEDLFEQPAFLTVKGPRAQAQRFEQEAEIPSEHAAALIELAPNRIRKLRHGVISEGNTWVVDVFEGENQGLVIAEFEGEEHEVRKIRRPWWCGREITEDARYNNENLAKTPWRQWEGDASD